MLSDRKYFISKLFSTPPAPPTTQEVFDRLWKRSNNLITFIFFAIISLLLTVSIFRGSFPTNIRPFVYIVCAFYGLLTIWLPLEQRADRKILRQIAKEYNLTIPGRKKK